MSDKIDHIIEQISQQLRDKAEIKVASGEAKALVVATDKLLHELRVHQVELEMQNEELRQAHIALEMSRAHYIELYDFAPIGYVTVSAKGMITQINLTGAKLLGVERKKIMHQCFDRFVADADRDRWYCLSLSIMADVLEEEKSFNLLLKRSDGTLFHAHANCLRRAHDGAFPVLQIAFTDVTQLKQTEDLRITAMAFESQEGMFITDANGVILQVNNAYTKINGYSAEEAIGQTPRMHRSGRHDKAFYKTLWKSINTKGGWHGEIWNRRKNGEIYPAWLTITAVQKTSDTARYYAATLTDITEQKVAAEQIEQLAFYDPLTNLPNRRLLKDRLNLALVHSTRSKQYGVLLFIDMDNFKTLNDTLGHNTGDLLLQQVASRLSHNVREIDIAARLGGDEFVVVLENLGENVKEAAFHAEIAGKKILAALNEPYLFDDYSYRCTPSIGITLFYGSEVDANDLLMHVDIAMYQAKNSGRNRLCFFDEAMQIALVERAALETDLRLALEKNQFELYYQMQVNHDNQIIGAEVLLRWQHPERGLISPSEFILMAEEIGLILPIGQWVLEAACVQLKHWENKPQTQKFQLAINVSASQLYQIDFARQVQDVLVKTHIEPSRLKIELTETMLLKGTQGIVVMQALKNLGVSLSMDDFGTGYSSLSYLTQLPLDQLKIDQSFVHNLGAKSSDDVIVQTIIGMGNNLNIEIIAEGVETEAQHAFLKQHGCSLFQGYLFSRPVPVDEFEELCLQNSL